MLDASQCACMQATQHVTEELPCLLPCTYAYMDSTMDVENTIRVALQVPLLFLLRCFLRVVLFRGAVEHALHAISRSHYQTFGDVSDWCCVKLSECLAVVLQGLLCLISNK